MRPANQTGVHHAVVAAKISGPRLSPYLTAMEGNVRRALSLYQWNVELSGSVYECLHRFEVILRNALDEQLRSWNALQRDRETGRTHSADWLLDPARLLGRLAGDDIRKAGRRAQTALRGAGRPPGHPDVLAQLSFGTWRFLLPDNDPGRQHLWNKALAAAFPRLSGAPSDLVDHVDHIYKLRNRVAHLEPLLNSGMVADRLDRMRTVLLAIDPALEAWFVSRQRVTATLKLKP
ncbi:hypothetical protein [Kribbella sp.]|uniref:hypothetical protein n=1 Tax=Kribbella sp. TaxID=1871183 RepID=UPI002D5EDCAF|nr:hypothetical protein [Kribbella sp.]HZX04383.1 hypothetical protein [Kribbella sp.]